MLVRARSERGGGTAKVAKKRNASVLSGDVSSRYLAPLLTEASSLASENRRRKKLYELKSVSPKVVDDYLAEKWEVDKKLKRLVRMKRFKGHDEHLEDRLWCLLYKLGYEELNQGRQFKVLIKRRGAEELEKQIDVFAKDAETVVVAECKSSAKLTKRKSLQKDLAEFATLKGPIANAIKKHYGKEFRPKILWLFVTGNIVWSEPDLARAQGHAICVLTDREMRYFNQLANHLGSPARYQFLAEYLKNQKIPELADHKIPAIRGKLGGKRFYCFITTPEHLLKIAFVNHRSLKDPDGFPTYQRLVTLFSTIRRNRL